MKRSLILLLAITVFSSSAWAVSTHPFTEPLSGKCTTSQFVQDISNVYPALSTPPISSINNNPPNWVLEIQTRLNYRVGIVFDKITLPDAMDTLSALFKVNIILTNEARSSTNEISLKLDSIRGGLALNWCCRLADANWLITDEAILVFLNSEVEEKEKVEEPSLEEILDILDENTYTPPDFCPPSDPFGRNDDGGY